MSKVIGLFPTPFMKVDGFLDGALRERIAARARDATEHNVRTDQLSHTEMVNPQTDPLFKQIAEQATPSVAEIGRLMFGDTLPWVVKEMWLNRLQPGGSQFMHTHANSFVSAIVYITRPHQSTRTVFRRSRGGEEFIFRHDGTPENSTPFSSDTWVMPDADAGDMVLYPSYLLHGVPPNEGEERISLAMNAVPERLKSFGYEVRFSS